MSGRESLGAGDGERRNFHRSARAPPATRRHAGHTIPNRDTAGHSLTSRLCRVPDMRGEVLPHVPDAWIDHDRTKLGYEIPFTRHFYVYTPPRPLAEIDAELRHLESQIQKLLGEVTR
jgi:hypothetical protein